MHFQAQLFLHTNQLVFMRGRGCMWIYFCVVSPRPSGFIVNMAGIKRKTSNDWEAGNYHKKRKTDGSEYEDLLCKYLRCRSMHVISQLSQKVGGRSISGLSCCSLVVLKGLGNRSQKTLQTIFPMTVTVWGWI